MAAQSQGPTEALISRLAVSRAVLGAELLDLRQRLDVPARVKKSILSKPVAWFGGSLGVGLLASLLLRRRKARSREPKARRAWWSLALGGAFTLARPALQSWALRELRKRFVIPGNDNVRSS